MGICDFFTKKYSIDRINRNEKINAATLILGANLLITRIYSICETRKLSIPAYSLHFPGLINNKSPHQEKNSANINIKERLSDLEIYKSIRIGTRQIFDTKRIMYLLPWIDKILINAVRPYKTRKNKFTLFKEADNCL